MASVRTSTSQVVVSLHDLSTNGYSINGVLRPPQKPVKLHKTAISTRTAVLCDGDVISFPEIDIGKWTLHKEMMLPIHKVSSWPMNS